MKKSISLVLLATIIFQSCAVYQKTSLTLDEAKDKGKVRVITSQGDALKFNNIVQKDSMYYGVRKISSDNYYGKVDVSMPLYPDLIESIYLKNKGATIVKSVLFLGAAGLVAWGVGMILILTVFGFGG